MAGSLAAPNWPFLGRALMCSISSSAGREGSQSKVVLGNRYVLYWGKIKDSKFLGENFLWHWHFCNRSSYFSVSRNGFVLILILCHSWI